MEPRVADNQDAEIIVGKVVNCCTGCLPDPAHYPNNIANLSAWKKEYKRLARICVSAGDIGSAIEFKNRATTCSIQRYNRAALEARASAAEQRVTVLEQEVAQYQKQCARSRPVVLACAAVGVVAVSLLIGAYGYHRTEGLAWIDALLDASMILTGMGPVHALQTNAGKLFATGYALFSGVMFLMMVALLLGPLVHRFLHRFHLELDEEDSDDGPPLK